MQGESTIVLPRMACKSFKSVLRSDLWHACDLHFAFAKNPQAILRASILLGAETCDPSLSLLGQGDCRDSMLLLLTFLVASISSPFLEST